MLDEQLRIKGWEKWYDDIAEMQKDLDAYLITCNTKRPHQGRGTNGKTPLAVFKSGIKKRPSKKTQKTPNKAII